MNIKKIGIFGLVLASAVVLSACSKTAGTPSGANSAANDQSNATQTTDVASADTITYSDDGFSPATLTVKAGNAITIKNTGSGNMSFNSDPHPTHTSFPELNLGPIGAGESKTLTLSKAGTYTYHNHLKASQKGTIVVE